MKAIKYVFAKDAAGLEKIQAAAVKSVQSARVSEQVAAVATIMRMSMVIGRMLASL
ncbi:MAG: hypothetical protein [Bacteriophage sp.]|nr:MAG: hypothetical protein [Bacteriophage sp.]